MPTRREFLVQAASTGSALSIGAAHGVQPTSRKAPEGGERPLRILVLGGTGYIGPWFVRAAVERGAVPIWMPRLDAGVAAEIEGKRLRFGQARDGQAPADQPGAILGPFDRSRVRKWMADMAASLVPIRSWIP